MHPQNTTNHASEHGATNPDSPVRAIVDSLPAKPPKTEEHKAKKRERTPCTLSEL
jgi:hypothetical protein